MADVAPAAVKPSQYRPDVDGLRAVAVIAVIGRVVLQIEALYSTPSLVVILGILLWWQSYAPAPFVVIAASHLIFPRRSLLRRSSTSAPQMAGRQASDDLPL